MRRQSADTSLEVEEILLEGYRQMGPPEKLRRISELNSAVWALAAARIRSQYGPHLSDHELHLRLAALRLDRTIMIEAFDWDPEEMRY